VDADAVMRLDDAVYGGADVTETVVTDVIAGVGDDVSPYIERSRCGPTTRHVFLA
jgi:hypothetical protein